MQVFEQESLTINIDVSENKVNMEWEGFWQANKSDSILNDYLDNLITELHDKELTISFNSLEAMSSSCFSTLIYFLDTLEENKIMTIISYDNHSFWQRTTFSSISQYSASMNYIKFT